MSARSAEEMSGFLDVKVPARVRRRRGLAPWKAWKKQWLTVRSASDSGVDVQLGSTCFRIPSKSILCRSESRSRPFAFGVFGCMEPRRPTLFLAGSSETDTQRWMRHIRDLLRPPHKDETVAGGFPVSFIDNAHSRLAGLTGMYGNLVVGPHSLTLHILSSEEPVFSWKWQQLHQFHLAATEIKDDENKVCVLHTSSEFCAGAGQLHVFCPQAPELLDRLLASVRVQRLLSSPLPSPPPLHRGARRLSRSESDLYCVTDKEIKALGSPRQHHHFVRRRGVLERSHSSSRTSATSDDYVQAIGGKVASSLISAGLGLLFSTPACSEADTESLHEYQQVGSLGSDEYDDEPGYSPLPTRRESGISIASGIYEEIADGDTQNSANHYENPSTLGCSRAAEDTGVFPPPLPPRKQRHNLLDSNIHKEIWREWCYRTPPISTQHGDAASGLPSFANCLPSHHTVWKGNTPPQPEPDYLPMSPSPARVMAEEQHYTVMASINTT